MAALKIQCKSIIFTKKRHIFFTGGAYYNLRKKIRRCRLCYLIGKKREKAIWRGGDFLWHSIDGIYSVYIADVTVSDVSFLWAGLANGVFGRNIKETTSDIAKENNAIFAINGDFYGRKNIS